MTSPEDIRTDHALRTRYFRPVEPVTFSAAEMIAGMFASINPAQVASLNQLHGDRKGVIRITCKSPDAATELESKVAAKRVQVNDVRLASVSDSGHFVKVTLLDVPDYLSGAEVEKELRDYGSVVHIRRDHIDYHGHRIENETRYVLFSTLIKEIPPRFSLDNYDVFASYRIEGVRSRVGEGGESDVCKEPLISCPQNIPKHVMNSIHSSSNKPDMTSGVVMGITSTVAEITDDEMSSSGGKSASTLEVNYQGTDGELGETGNFETVRRKRASSTDREKRGVEFTRRSIAGVKSTDKKSTGSAGDSDSRMQDGTMKGYRRQLRERDKVDRDTTALKPTSLAMDGIRTVLVSRRNSLEQSDRDVHRHRYQQLQSRSKTPDSDSVKF